MPDIIMRKEESVPVPRSLAEMSLESISLITLLTRQLLIWQAQAIAAKAEAAVLRVFR